MGVETERGAYRAPVVVDAAGPFSRELCRTAGVEIPVTPDSARGGHHRTRAALFHVSCGGPETRSPVQELLFLSEQAGSGRLLHYALSRSSSGTDKRETSTFLPQVGARMVRLLPRLKNLRVRRVWRGLYPMTRDGSPLVGWNHEVEGLLHATGMCGQGFMLGPGTGELVARVITGSSRENDSLILSGFSPYRKSGGEALK